MQLPPTIRRYAKWTMLLLGISIAVVALWYLSRLSTQLRHSEEEKVRLWARAISQKNQMVRYTDIFFDNIALDEHRKMALYTRVLNQLGSNDLHSDIEISLAYVNYIMDSARTATIIVDRDSIITSCRNIFNDSIDATLIGQKLEGALLEQFSQHPPFHYRVWGMPFTLYYKESHIFTDMRHMLDNLNNSFLTDITNNSIFVPVIIVDSLRNEVIGSGNINPSEFDTPSKLATRLDLMADHNDPIEILLPNSQLAYVYYESTPLLRTLSWFPLLYVFISIVLIVLAYLLLRTTRTMEQNRIWVGMAKETAHQLGTPISSLQGWADYLDEHPLTPEYSQEIHKDLNRLETIAHRFSKIGSIPELKDDDVAVALRTAIDYMQGRSPRKVHYNVNIPDQPLLTPLNRYLFEWVIENLCKNAIDAMSGNGTISVIATHDQRYIYIDLADTGRGIPSSQQKHIFESGFTTKQRGWGLGLSLARRIINEYHHGKIYLKYSIVGQGTVFRIVLKKTPDSQARTIKDSIATAHNEMQ